MREAPPSPCTGDGDGGDEEDGDCARYVGLDGGAGDGLWPRKDSPKPIPLPEATARPDDAKAPPLLHPRADASLSASHVPGGRPAKRLDARNVEKSREGESPGLPCPAAVEGEAGTRVVAPEEDMDGAERTSPIPIPIPIPGLSDALIPAPELRSLAVMSTSPSDVTTVRGGTRDEAPRRTLERMAPRCSASARHAGGRGRARLVPAASRVAIMLAVPVAKDSRGMDGKAWVEEEEGAPTARPREVGPPVPPSPAHVNDMDMDDADTSRRSDASGDAERLAA